MQVVLCHQLMWYRIGDRVLRESAWGIVQNAFDPLSRAVVGHDPVFEALEAWVLYLVQPVTVEDRYERVMVGDDGEVRKAREEQLAFGDGP